MDKRFERFKANQKMIGKTVKVLSGASFWIGEVVDVVDAETLRVRGKDSTEEVDLFDIRSPEEEE